MSYFSKKWIPDPHTKFTLTPYSGNEQKKRKCKAVQIVCKNLQAMFNINYPYLYKSSVLGREMSSVGVMPDYKLEGSTSRLFYDKRGAKLQGRSR